MESFERSFLVAYFLFLGGVYNLLIRWVVVGRMFG